ncbi:hypothetical protein D9O50_05880 [Oxalobacteraceae bacterium CAVE-383]|nr:hypothetical protein D9O50_05880 [Oxalobacteraceae bacterium CAVE-383]
MALQTRNVFIDTQAFVKAGLDFQSKTIQAFTEACELGEFNHIATTITIQEIQDKITDAISEGLSRVLDFRRKAKLLEGSNDPIIAGLFATYDPAQVQTRALEVFQSFIDDCKTTALDLKKVDADEVFRRYFRHEAPFQEGKKKDEFPDAFSLLAVEAHLGEKEECYIVSEDGDLRAFCEVNKRFLLIENLGKLLDIYNSHDDERSESIKSYLVDHEDGIKEEIEKQINEADFYNASTWEDADVVLHKVLAVQEYDPDIIRIDDESCLVAFEVAVLYEVQVEGPDFINGIYDRESGRLITFDRTVREEEQAFEVKVEVELDFELQDGKFKIVDMEVVVLGLNSGVEVAVEEEEFIDPRM